MKFDEQDPVRFDSFQGGKIHGCTDKFGSDELGTWSCTVIASRCSCPTGHEELGCQDSVNVSSGLPSCAFSEVLGLRFRAQVQQYS